MSEGPIRITQPLLAVLDALLEAEGNELHGWAIMKATGCSGPTIYKILERLAEAGWLTSRWEDEIEPGRPRRRYYQFTGKGVTRSQAVVHERRQAHTAGRMRPALGSGLA